MLAALNERAGFTLAPALIALLPTGVGTAAVTQVHVATDQAERVQDHAKHGIDLIGGLQYHVQEARRSMLYALTTEDGNVQAQHADGSREEDRRAAEISKAIARLDLSADQLSVEHRF